MKEKDSYSFNKHKTITKLGINLRGLYLNEIITLEQSISFYIAASITSTFETQIKILNSLIDRITFNEKKNILKSLLDKKAIEGGFIKTKNKWPHSDLLHEIQDLTRIRNYFAHYVLDIYSEEAYNRSPKECALVEYRDGVDRKWFSLDSVEILIHKIHKCQEEITQLNIKHNL